MRYKFFVFIILLSVSVFMFLGCTINEKGDFLSEEDSDISKTVNKNLSDWGEKIVQESKDKILETVEDNINKKISDIKNRLHIKIEDGVSNNTDNTSADSDLQNKLNFQLQKAEHKDLALSSCISMILAAQGLKLDSLYIAAKLDFDFDKDIPDEKVLDFVNTEVQSKYALLTADDFKKYSLENFILLMKTVQTSHKPAYLKIKESTISTEDKNYILFLPLQADEDDADLNKHKFYYFQPYTDNNDLKNRVGVIEAEKLYKLIEDDENVIFCYPLADQFN